MQDEMNIELDELALRIDDAALEGRSEELRRIDAICKKKLAASTDLDALLHYFRANIYAALQDAEEPRSWAWRQPNRERQILYLRRARTARTFAQISLTRRAQIGTNLANNMNTFGRPVEALRIYETVLRESPNFAMAIANRGLARLTLARMIYDDGHRAVLAAHAWQDFERVLNGDVEWDGDYPEMRAAVSEQAAQVRDAVDVEAVLAETDMHAWQVGQGEERIYRERMLEMGLFLNPLVVIGPYPIAALDPLHLPSHTYGLEEPPHYLRWYNQLKQEFVAARLLFHEAVEGPPFEDRGRHFADDGTHLIDTLDYPEFSIGAEKLRLSFRTAYGLLDKIAGFLNTFFKLGRRPNQVDLRGIWYKDPRRRDALAVPFHDRPNLALRGLYWLSFDILGSRGSHDDSIEPTAAHLSSLRNLLEHRCLVLCSEFALHDDSPIDREELTVFQRHTVRMLQLAHEALILLSLAMYEEERRRDRGSDAVSVPLYLPKYDTRRH
ncbi:LA2681 family HEPN domain-containing protein [Roseovarius atlanticus]|nr:LA2681 family HEPN domain-containing protein [Roseovarius atlanticus]